MRKSTPVFIDKKKDFVENYFPPVLKVLNILSELLQTQQRILLGKTITNGWKVFRIPYSEYRIRNTIEVRSSVILCTQRERIEEGTRVDGLATKRLGVDFGEISIR